MILFAIGLSNLSSTSSSTTLLFPAAKQLHSAAAHSSSSLKPLLLSTSASISLSSSLTANSTIGNSNDNSNRNSDLLHHVTRTLTDDEPEGIAEMVSSASAVASAIRRGSNSPVEFVQKIEKAENSKLVLPILDFRRLCVEQLDLFRRIVHSNSSLSVYVRPAGSYVMDRLELRRITSYPGNASDVVVLVANFNIPTCLRAAEAALSNQQVEFMPDHRAFVFPMLKHPFVVGFLVAELPLMELVTSCDNGQSEGSDLIDLPSPEEAYALLSTKDGKFSGIQTLNDEPLRTYNFTAEQKSNVVNISRSLAMAYVMDQKAMLLQQSSWQNNIRMNNLVEQIRGPLSSIRTLSKMLSAHMRKSEISYDIVEDIKIQGNQIRDTLQELQEAVYLTKANIMHYNEEALQKIPNSSFHHHDSLRSQFSDDTSTDTGNHDNWQGSGELCSLNDIPEDLEMPYAAFGTCSPATTWYKTVQCL